ncbi:dihydroxyacetone kinase phosphoryl donor subunit DhaM [Orbus sturtevantii]|uniref:dihydroxyacetone kinase phosphoryl donor subunit DhaM n=1 Tax=Orbus sturtevantii TaxID=3074109 RepID=UPI00370D6F07
MISLILVAHSKMITDGLKHMIDGMANNNNVTAISAGGMENGAFGTNPITIYDAIIAESESEKILIFTDLGSAVLSAEMAIDMLTSEVQSKVSLVDAPLVEGAFITAVQITDLNNLDDVIAEVEEM